MIVNLVEMEPTRHKLTHSDPSINNNREPDLENGKFQP